METIENQVNRNWLEFGEGPTQAFNGIYATMNRNGEIVINKTAFEELKHPEAVVLLFDPATDTIGIKPASPLMPNAFKTKTKSNCGNFVIRALPFARKHDIQLDGTVRFRTAVIENGILALSLRHLENASRKKQNLRKKR